MIRVETTNQMILTDLNVFFGVKRHRNHGGASRTLQSDLHHPKGAQDVWLFNSILETCFVCRHSHRILGSFSFPSFYFRSGFHVFHPKDMVIICCMQIPVVPFSDLAPITLQHVLQVIHISLHRHLDCPTIVDLWPPTGRWPFQPPLKPCNN